MASGFETRMILDLMPDTLSSKPVNRFATAKCFAWLLSRRKPDLASSVALNSPLAHGY